MVIIDTSIWVEVLRLADSPLRPEFERLVYKREAAAVGIIHTELLRGARSDEELERLQERLDVIPFLETSKATWTLAGRLLSELERRGEGISLPDAIIAALALEGDHALFTRDEHFSRVPALKLHVARDAS